MTRRLMSRLSLLQSLWTSGGSSPTVSETVSGSQRYRSWVAFEVCTCCTELPRYVTEGKWELQVDET